MAGLEVTKEDVEKADDKEASEKFAKGVKKDFEGGGVVNDIASLGADIGSGNWAEGLLDAAGAAGSLATFAADPLASLGAAGFGWAMEHVKFLKEPLDWLTGDQDAIKASSQTWGNVAKDLGESQTQFADAVKADTAPWHGPAIDAYKPFAAAHATLITGAATGANAASTVISMCGTVLEVVRGIVRDLISQAAGDLLACLLEWAAAEVLSLGLATPGLVGDLIRRAVVWAGKITKWVKKVTKVLKTGESLLKKLKELLAKLEPMLAKLRESKVGQAVGKANDFAHGKAGELAESKFGQAVKKAHEPFENVPEAPKRVKTPLIDSDQYRASLRDSVADRRDVKINWPKDDPDILKHAANKFAEETPKKFAEKGAESFDDNVLHDDDDKKGE